VVIGRRLRRPKVPGDSSRVYGEKPTGRDARFERRDPWSRRGAALSIEDLEQALGSD
jgi:hypothetical protein